MNSTNIRGEDGGYITSSRAAQLSGYSQDYVGQLCRSGSVECKRVSGEWQVKLASILAYKKRFNPNLPGETSGGGSVGDAYDMSSHTGAGHQDTLSHGGKTYISSGDAAKATGYSQDYIGQLARSGSVIAKKVGRKWFVERESLEQHKDHNDGLLAAVQAGAAGIGQVPEVSGSANTVLEKGSLNNDEGKEKATHSIPIVTYQRDDGSLVPGAHTHQEETDIHTPEIKTMPVAPIRKDLRTHALPRIEVPVLPRRNTSDVSKEQVQIGGRIRRRGQRGGLFLAILCSTLSLVFIISAAVFPEATSTYTHATLDNMGIPTGKSSIRTNSYLGKLLDRVSDHSVYIKE